MNSFFFPCLWLVPKFRADVCDASPIILHKRKWDVSIFDLYSLVAKRHPVRVPVEIMHVFLQSVNLEIETKASDFGEASDTIDCFRAMLHLRGTRPTVAPFATNISLNQYAGINQRSSGNRDQMHPGLRQGITHDDCRIHSWANELAFSCFAPPAEKGSWELYKKTVVTAASDLSEWQTLERHWKHLRPARRALVKAPLMPDIESSILQIWQGIESLFPTVSSEVTFRTSLLLAELISPLGGRRETYDMAKKSYSDRSRIVHGSQKSLSMVDWYRAWSLLRDALSGVLARKSLPKEDELTMELLRR